MKGINLALRWVLKETVIRTASGTVHSWTHSIIKFKEERSIPRCHGNILKSLFGIFGILRTDFSLKLRTRFFYSFTFKGHKRDTMIRVRKKWLEVSEERKSVADVYILEYAEAKEICNMHQRTAG